VLPESFSCDAGKSLFLRLMWPTSKGCCFGSIPPYPLVDLRSAPSAPYRPAATNTECSYLCCVLRCPILFASSYSLQHDFRLRSLVPPELTRIPSSFWYLPLDYLQPSCPNPQVFYTPWSFPRTKFALDSFSKFNVVDRSFPALLTIYAPL